VEELINYFSPDEKEEIIVQFIHDTKLNKCPHITIKFGNKKVKALMDSGSQVSLLSREICEELTESGYPTLKIPLQSTVLTTAFRNKSRRIRLQGLLDFSISSDTYEHIFLISLNLLTPVILGADFLYDNRVSIDSEDEFIKTEKKGQYADTNLRISQEKTEIGDGIRGQTEKVKMKKPTLVKYRDPSQIKLMEFNQIHSRSMAAANFRGMKQ
jgi:hypothetical protein